MKRIEDLLGGGGAEYFFCIIVIGLLPQQPLYFAHGLGPNSTLVEKVNFLEHTV